MEKNNGYGTILIKMNCPLGRLVQEIYLKTYHLSSLTKIELMLTYKIDKSRKVV